VQCGWDPPLRAGNPFNTAWRRDKGGLWDLAPHLISLLWASLGPVQLVTAQAGLADVTQLILRHEPRATGDGGPERSPERGIR
jgi:predicted dehydrogenase